MLPQASILISIILVISVGHGQTCTPVFDVGVEISSPLDTITFDNLGSTVPWNSVTPTPFRITPDSSMEVNITGNVASGYVQIRTGYTDLSTSSWNKADNYMTFQTFLNVAILTFASPIRQFSMQLANAGNCFSPDYTPYITVQNSSGITIANGPLYAQPTGLNAYRILRFRSTCAEAKTVILSGCQIVMDNMRYKIDPCSPNPCNSTTENCFDAGLDATCCLLNATWNGVKCLTGNPCIDDTPCDPLATCDPLRTGGYTCTCPPTYIGNGAPGNCTLLPPAPSNVTYNISPILECIDENNVAQFGYISNETNVLLINDPLRNNLEPLNIAPVVVFTPGQSRGYPLNPGQVLLNVTATEYVWQLENNRLTFSKSALACPIEIRIIMQFAITGTVNLTLFGQQVRSAFIFATSVQSDRVTLVNVTVISTSVNKRSTMQQDLTELEVELSVAPPTNDTQPSAAEVIRNFVSNQQDDLQYDLDQSNPNATIATSVVTTKGAPLLNPPKTSEAPTSETPSSMTPPASGPSQSPTSFIASSAQTVHLCYLLSPLISLLWL